MWIVIYNIKKKNFFSSSSKVDIFIKNHSASENGFLGSGYNNSFLKDYFSSFSDENNVFVKDNDEENSDFNKNSNTKEKEEDLKLPLHGKWDEDNEDTVKNDEDISEQFEESNLHKNIDVNTQKEENIQNTNDSNDIDINLSDTDEKTLLSGVKKEEDLSEFLVLKGLSEESVETVEKDKDESLFFDKNQILTDVPSEENNQRDNIDEKQKRSRKWDVDVLENDIEKGLIFSVCLYYANFPFLLLFFFFLLCYDYFLVFFFCKYISTIYFKIILK
jgi:hypothetical protein